MKPTPLLLTALCLASAPPLVAQSYYSGPSFFSQRPDETKSLTTIDRFGPVGMAIDLIQPAFTMRIKSIEEGSPHPASSRPGRSSSRSTASRSRTSIHASSSAT
jgi:hypothetical protein